MSIRTIAIVSPGAMGHAVGRILRERGLDVVTCLEGRSARTRGLAGAAGIQDMPSLEAMVAAADLVLSIMPSRAAALVARRIADAMLATDKAPAFAECNAIAPEHVRQIAAALAPTGAAFIDAGIVGPPPEGGRVTRFYASGAQAGLLEVLEGGGLEVRILGEEVGQASALKMCYAGLTKGAQGLYAAVLVAAEALGLSEPLAAQMRDSEAEAWAPDATQDAAPAGSRGALGRGDGGDRGDLVGDRRHAPLPPGCARHVRANRRHPTRERNPRGLRPEPYTRTGDRDLCAVIAAAERQTSLRLTRGHGRDARSPQERHVQPRKPR